MGLLKESKILTWEETEKHSSEMKKNGIDYFIRTYTNNSTPRIKEFLWGDELEQNLIIKIKGNWFLLLGAGNLLNLPKPPEAILHPEYAGYMIESTPNAPYEPGFKELPLVEKKFEKRREAVQKMLREQFGEEASILFLPCFPLIGTFRAFGTGGLSESKWKEKWMGNFEKAKLNYLNEEFKEVKYEGTPLETALKQASEPTFYTTQSAHFPDFAITSHRRFFGFSKNIVKRKQAPLYYSVPVANIEARAKSAKKEKIAQNSQTESKNDQIAVIDSMGQGMGCCCLQITMQSESLSEARTLYDNIGAICPLLLFLTMGTPIADGKLIETSTRWKIVGSSVDCRRESETHIRKSRYSSIDLYTSELPEHLEKIYNDISPPLEEDILEKLLGAGVDRAMAKHISSLYIRDPVLCYADATDVDDFENIQSSNWRSMRLKLPKPSPGNSSPWLVEVRPMEIQPTSFENTAYSIFVILFSRMMLSLNANFYLPISKVDENFIFADKQGTSLNSLQDYINAEQEQEFWYRENIFSDGLPVVKKGTIKEIFVGSGEYIGILGAIQKYLDEYASAHTDAISPYLQFIRERVTGTKTSLSTFIRKFVSNHPAYEGDSLVSQEVSNDLIDRILSITEMNSAEYLNASADIEE
ncbi:glutamate--cysteine ligase catalytic subunit [Nematocida minor]|uniref:glutamate--cysteine ligase catalytic subunit n=1 Tax=Nematocida minor TaxID=1912983 RepID=UPI00221FE27F|nr:glutamate--cysteine ligase catalytic subunit [Nematocida minor]KAI5189466.1 glutamate--cysteine ligase catalytic subunit [Nematocida minor]